MTEKRFYFLIDSEDELAIKDEITNKQYSMEQEDTVRAFEKELNHLHEENNQLREIIKLSHYNEICEHCKYGEYWITQDYWSGGKEGNFKCHKGHPPEDCCDIQECSDYELKDLKELLKEYKND